MVWSCKGPFVTPGCPGYLGCYSNYVASASDIQDSQQYFEIFTNVNTQISCSRHQTVLRNLLKLSPTGIQTWQSTWWMIRRHGPRVLFHSQWMNVSTQKADYFINSLYKETSSLMVCANGKQKCLMVHVHVSSVQFGHLLFTRKNSNLHVQRKETRMSLTLS